MKTLFFITFLIILASCSTTKETTPVDSKNLIEPIIPSYSLNSVPVYPGCDTSIKNKDLITCLSKGVGNHVRSNFNMNYLINNNIQKRRIIASFVINSNGKVAKVTANEKNPILLAETKRVLFSIPRMIPAKKNNQNVATSFALPITLVLE
ncbi:hypothetical protein [Kangiella sp. HZ709]|uniref:hypothetical protein n=1 Tax=Kangiella sp. HZ709 TaxID=2666328 RepID=UPI0012B10D6A|nr:hypothetical protein [Kangiella sp. HZ709]MRX27440.1 hypothetical protein [Kangiella sp. HZ709]